MNDVIKVDKNNKERLLSYLDESLEKQNINYGVSYVGENITINIYNTGKVLFQGKESSYWYDKVVEKLNISAILEKVESVIRLSEEVNRIGSDESGKGDFFGPLITAGFYIKSEKQEQELMELGVKDSKKISDKKILDIAKQLYQMNTSEVVIIGVSKYNELYDKMQNLNLLLAWSHARVIENLLTKFDCKTAIADQFGDESLINNTLFSKGKTIKLVQTPKAERDLAVAAASILARATYLDKLKKLGNQIGFELPKGAGENVIDVGVSICKKHGISALDAVSKRHFKTYNEVKGKYLGN